LNMKLSDDDGHRHAESENGVATSNVPPVESTQSRR
jgi:hypothetical protein